MAKGTYKRRRYFYCCKEAKYLFKGSKAICDQASTVQSGETQISSNSERHINFPCFISLSAGETSTASVSRRYKIPKCTSPTGSELLIYPNKEMEEIFPFICTSSSTSLSKQNRIGFLSTPSTCSTCPPKPQDHFPCKRLSCASVLLEER